jgi:hypothetical protein
MELAKRQKSKDQATDKGQTKACISALFVLALPTTAPWLKVCTALRLPPEIIRFSGLPSRVQSFFEYWKLLSVFLRCAADLVQRNAPRTKDLMDRRFGFPSAVTLIWS